MKNKTPRYASLKAWREAHGLSTHQAARSLEIPQTNYYRYERGIRFPPGPVAKRLKERTGVPLDVLVGAV